MVPAKPIYVMFAPFIQYFVHYANMQMAICVLEFFADRFFQPISDPLQIRCCYDPATRFLSELVSWQMASNSKKKKSFFQTYDSKAKMAESVRS